MDGSAKETATEAMGYMEIWPEGIDRFLYLDVDVDVYVDDENNDPVERGHLPKVGESCWKAEVITVYQ